MNVTELLKRSEELSTDIGKAFLCERAVLRGKDIHHEIGNWDWFKTNVFAITERELSENQIKFLNYMWVATAYPDPSIWPNHVAALGGSARTSCSLSMMAGMAISEASIYGRKPERKALNFFYRLDQQLQEGKKLEEVLEEELLKRKVIYGYGRPLAKLDERIPHTLHKIKELGLDNGKFYRRALEIYHYLKNAKGLSINIAAINTSVVADMGLTTEEYQLLLTPCFITGMIPSYIDSRDKPEGGFFPVQCDAIEYHGEKTRVWNNQN